MCATWTPQFRLVPVSTIDYWRYERSSRLIRNLSNCERAAWKKFRLQRDSNPWPLRYRCSALPTELWSHNCWEQVNFSGSIMPLRVVQLLTMGPFTWTQVGCQPGSCRQPGSTFFLVLIKKRRVMSTNYPITSLHCAPRWPIGPESEVSVHEPLRSKEILNTLVHLSKTVAASKMESIGVLKM